jgi:hypothetical protein
LNVRCQLIVLLREALTRDDERGEPGSPRHG